MISVASFEGGDLLTTKHQQLLEYIEQLPLGSKISVRQMARTSGGQRGHWYRALKEAEARGLVSAMPRVGTYALRSRKNTISSASPLPKWSTSSTAPVLGGRAGLHKAPEQVCNRGHENRVHGAPSKPTASS